jgi:dihydrolipoamide dehydrogenase
MKNVPIFKHVDIAILGAGTAGLSAYSAARKHTQNLLLIDRPLRNYLCPRWVHAE